MTNLHGWPIVLAIATALLVMMVALIVRAVRRSRVRKALGLPPDTKLGDRHKRMYQAFEDTDLRLSKLPFLSLDHRQELARELLRDKGILPKKSKERGMQ